MTELMVQPQTSTTCFDNSLQNKLQNRKKKCEEIFNSFEISKHIISKFAGRLLIGRNDSLDVHLFKLRIMLYSNDKETYTRDI